MQPLFTQFSGPQLVPAVFHRSTTTTDRYGDKVTTVEDHAVDARFAPARPAEDGSGATTPAAVYLDGTGFVPDSTDTVTVASALWTIEGEPEVWHGAGVVVHLSRYGVQRG